MISINTYTLQFLYLLLAIVGAGYYLYESFKIKKKLIKFVEFYDSYLKTVINIKVEDDYFNGKDRLWHGKDSIEWIEVDDLTFLFTRSPVLMLGGKDRVRLISYFYFSDEFNILGELDTKISPVVNDFIQDKKLDKLLRRYWKPYKDKKFKLNN